MPRARKNPYEQEPVPVRGSPFHPPKPPRPALQAQLMRIGAIGTDFALAVIVAGILGYFADMALGTRPWLFMSGLIVGLIAGFYRFVREAMAENRKLSRKRQ
jgi:F0F1-type ATP synthase assembly protein I